MPHSKKRNASDHSEGMHAIYGSSLTFLLMLAAAYFNDLQMFDPSTSSWTELTDSAAGTLPSPRNSLGFTSTAAKLYVHGGSGDSGKMKEIIFAPCKLTRILKYTSFEFYRACQ